MIQTNPHSKTIKAFFYIISAIIVLLFLVTILGIGEIINEKGKHPIFTFFNAISDLNIEEVFYGIIGLGFFGYLVIASFIGITLIIFLLLSKLDLNLKQIRWTEANYLPENVKDWMDVSFSTFVITLLSVMTSIIISTIFYSYRY